ncbi:MAG: 2-hydroxychromene-2-carboxylate isomerase [Rhodospirillales bacterium]|nr:2-hydroxychromene-2-carboxylate isomerase [Rhodospirillales bacterium]
MASKLIEFYFDFSSPYAYFAALQMEDFCDVAGCTVMWRPMMLGAAFKASGNKPLTEQPMKAEYSRHDMDRLARKVGAPWRWPDTFPIATLGAARAFYWLEGTAGVEKAKEFAMAAFDAYFGHGRNISDPEVLAEVATSIGLDPVAMAEACKDDKVKDRLRFETEEAIGRGVFGSPFFFVDGEPFWGQDRLPMMQEWVNSGGW